MDPLGFIYHLPYVMMSKKGPPPSKYSPNTTVIFSTSLSGEALHSAAPSPSADSEKKSWDTGLQQQRNGCISGPWRNEETRNHFVVSTLVPCFFDWNSKNQLGWETRIF